MRGVRAVHTEAMTTATQRELERQELRLLRGAYRAYEPELIRTLERLRQLEEKLAARGSRECEPTLDSVRKLAEQFRDETQSWYRHLREKGVDRTKLGRVATLVAALTSSTQLLADVLEGFHHDMRRIVAPEGDWQAKHGLREHKRVIDMDVKKSLITHDNLDGGHVVLVLFEQSRC
jgi:hypothetical protein